MMEYIWMRQEKDFSVFLLKHKFIARWSNQLN